MKRNRVFITAQSLATPLGCTMEDFKLAMFAGSAGIRKLDDLPAFANFPSPYAGRIQEQYFANCALPFQRQSYAVASMAKEILRPLAGMNLRFDAIVSGSRNSTAFDIANFCFRNGKLPTGFLEALSPEALTNTASQLISAHGNIPPPSSQEICVTNACITGSSIIGDAFHRIRAGAWKRALLFALELDDNPLAMVSLHLLGALNTEIIDPTNSSRPFSSDRNGFIKSEGAGMIILESEESAEARGAEILGEVIGYSSTTDAWQLTSSREDLSGATSAILSALSDAETPASAIDYINGHGTGTSLGDAQECLAIKSVFGARAHEIPVSSLKSQIGHTTVACGIIEAIATGLMMKAQRAAPTLNYKGPSIGCDLDFVPDHSRAVKMQYALSINFGFGGQNSCLVFKRV